MNPPPLHHGGGMNLHVHPRVNLRDLIPKTKCQKNLDNLCEEIMEFLGVLLNRVTQ